MTGKSWEISQCDVGTTSTNRESVLLDGTTGTASSHKHCKAISSKIIPGDRYEISVDVKNNYGWRGVNSGHPGVIFNVKDSLNYDMVYFR